MGVVQLFNGVWTTAAFHSELVAPVIIMLACLPLIAGIVPQNRWYGVRTPNAMKSESHWYRINRIGGVLLIAAAVVQIAVALMLTPTDPWRPLRPLPYVVSAVAILVLDRKLRRP